MEISYRTEDGVTVKEGDRVYNYYDMKPGVIGRHVGNVPDPWFEFVGDDGKITSLNGQRICSMGFARSRGFRDADS